MSIDKVGINCKLNGANITISISENHPLIKLANTIDWVEMQNIILPDLQSSTAKAKWWLGRPLRLRIHLGVYLLQQCLSL